MTMSDENGGTFYVSPRCNGKTEDIIARANPVLAAIIRCPASDIWYKVRTPETDIRGAYFQPPYTTVKWSDGTTTTVKCDAEDAYDPEKGVLLCFAKRLFAGGKYNDALRKALGMVPDLSGEITRVVTLNDGSRLFYRGDGSIDRIEINGTGDAR
jgi:hypothetical protein